MKKSFVVYTVLALAIVLFMLSIFFTQQTKNQSSSIHVPDEVTVNALIATSTNEVIAKKQKEKDTIIPINKPAVSVIHASLLVDGRTYSLNIPEGSTVRDMMNMAASTSQIFSFHEKLFSGIGYFVDEINGIKNTSNAYWFYYLNGSRANVGISSYVLKPNDKVEWKFESGM